MGEAHVWPNGQLVFLHTRNYMVAHGVIALPRNTQLHHVDGEPLNASAINTVAMLMQEHHALHSHERGRGRTGTAKVDAGKRFRKACGPVLGY